MKQFTLLALVMLLSAQAFGQKKKKLDPEEAAMRIDSLMLANTALATQLDSVTKQLDAVNKQLATHQTMYGAIKEKVMHGDFDPARTGELIDSLKTNRDAGLAGLTSETQALKDSLGVLSAENAKLSEAVKSWESRAADNEAVVEELNQLKGLLDKKIITQAEFDERKAKVMARWK
ncbi:MAG: SHOCT domain-containing protein [Flavobacteriales bacterium]|nr:SHOCT domain-containing protein [Flavobacteriales bacterium]HRH71189.1 SHOCT domain-containing protein [Flavobacteriales bacterium]